MRVALLLGSASILALGSVGAKAQDAGATQLEEIEVIGTTPIGGDGLDRDKVPANVRTIQSDALRSYDGVTVQDGFSRQTPSVSVTDVTGNPFNKEVFFRGFQSSPTVGIPQGLAVYQNGVRINESFGDTVNYDLLPQVAIDRTDIWTNNPVFGLNALGGALSFQTKSGFTFQGLELETQMGSFGRYQGSAQWGTQVGPWAAYIALEGAEDGGWRDFSASKVRRVFGDIGYKTDSAEIHLNATYSDNLLGVVGPTPLELLEQRRRNVYTGDQTSSNQMAMLNLQGKFEINDAWSVQANAYYRRFKRVGVDGNDTEAVPCDDNPNFMCFDDDEFPGVRDRYLWLRDPKTGRRVRNPGFPADEDDFGPGTTPGSIEHSRTLTNAGGGTVQATNESEFFGKKNHFVIGASYDYGQTDFSAWSELCIIPADLQCIGTGQKYYALAPGGIIPTDVFAKNHYLGLYASDTFDLTDKLSVTAGARLNYAKIITEDRRTIFPLNNDGTRADQGLDGNHSFTRLNPMIGATYKFTDAITGFASYSESNRAPTPLELACADENAPCPLEASLVSDPPLKQVVTRTGEAGFRGKHALLDGMFTWSASVYRADNTNDIFQVPGNLSGTGYFVNAGKTRRQGVELSAQYASQKWAFYANYSYVDATFRKNILLASNSPNANDDGELQVKKGDHLTGIPAHQFKLGGAYQVLPKWTVGGDLTVMGSQYLVGDESNQSPKLPAYAVVDVNTSYQVTEQFRLFGGVKNLFDKKYNTYGTFFETDDIGFLGLNDPRTFTPARPLTIYAGVNFRFVPPAPVEPIATR